MQEVIDDEMLRCQQQFLKRVGVSFYNDDLLRQSFTDSSWCPGGEFSKGGNNQRLEFFGDAVISVLVSEYLLSRFPYKNEGELTIIRSALTRGTALAELAEHIGMEPCICWQKSESVVQRRRVLANAFEAFVGALAYDQGYEPCRSFLRSFMLMKSRVNELQDARTLISPKNKLQTRASKTVGVNPKYRIVKEIGCGHDKEFIAEVLIRGRSVAQGKGLSKIEAEEAAAHAALAIYSKKTLRRA